MLDSRSVRNISRTIVLASMPLLLSACGREAEPPPPAATAWDRVDLWEVRPIVEMTPEVGKWQKPMVKRISFLGSEEVRNLALVPAQQLVNVPKRPSGQVKALEQRAGSRVRWEIVPGEEAYFSFVPLGTTNGCACTYRIGVREAPGKIRELYRVEAAPVGPIAPATVEVDLGEYAGMKIDLMVQADGPAGTGQPFPTVLWGSPGLYGRKALPGVAQAPEAARQARPNILLLGIDTLRADHLGAWGREPSLSPSIDLLAEQSDVWLEAFSTFNVTNPSFASILTGFYGKNHGVYDLQTPLPASHTTLAELLSGAGYDTQAYISAHHLGDHNSGLGQGFSNVFLAEEHAAAEMPVDMAMDWIAGRDGGAGQARPFFLWLHLFDPHTPHTPPQPFALGSRPASPAGLSPARTWVPFRQPGPAAFTEPVLAASRELYDGEVAYLDRQVGRLLGFLESRGSLEDTIVVLVADHGESLGEHGISFRHAGLHDTTTHVPLMIRWPGGPKGRRLSGLVQTIDLFPTLVAAAGLPVPAQDGEDLRELTGKKRNGRRAVFAEHAGKLGLMVRTRDHKYILSQGNERFVPDGAYLYDLKADPKEDRNLVGRGLPAEKELADLVRRWLADHHKRPSPESRALSDEERQRLKALGYL